LFVLFGTSHIAVVTAILSVALALIAVVRVWGGVRLARTIRWTLATVLIFTWVLWFLLLYEEGWASIATLLPMNLCDWAAIVVVITLIRPNQRTYELAYFWALGGTTLALLTPDLAVDFPDPRYVVFFALHGGVVVAALLFTLGLRMRPWPSSIPRVVAWSLVYLGIATAVNGLFDTNFGYLVAKPIQPSLLDYFAPWPYYLGEETLLACAIIALLYAPFVLQDRFAARRDLHGK
jgi:hypothetical integral membrane protein (TIGR02206 family)